MPTFGFASRSILSASSFCAGNALRGGVGIAKNRNPGAPGESVPYRARFALLTVALVLAVPAFAFAQETKPEQKAEAKSPPEAVALYAQAAELQNEKAFETAAEDWTKFLTKYPNDPLTPKAQHYQGVCNLQLKRYDKAAAAFQVVVTKYPKLDAIEDAYLNLGWCQFTQAQQGQAELYKSASATFAALLKAHPKSKYADQAYFFQAESLYHQKQLKEAVASYEQLRQDFPKSTVRADGLYALGVTHEELKQFAEAGAVYDDFLKEFETSPLVTEIQMRKAETVLQAGLAAEAAKKDADAKKLFAQAEAGFAAVAGVKDFASADHAIYRQALCVSKQDRPTDAAALYAKLSKEFPNSVYVKDSLLSAGRTFYAGKQYDEAAQAFEKVLAGNEAAAAEAAHWLCRIHLRNKKPAAVIELANQMLPKVAAESPYLISLKMDLADALYETPDKQPEALALYLKILADHPQAEAAAEALYNAAFTALQLKKLDDGLKHAAAFLATYKGHRLEADVKYVAAECNLLLKKYPEAEKAFSELLTTAANHEQAELWRVRQALSLFLQKKHAETASALQTVVGGFKTPANLAEGQYLVGASKFELGQFDEAAKALAASLAADPKWRQADETTLLLARSLAKLDKRDEALQSLKQFVDAFPESKLLDQAHYRWGEISKAGGDLKTAVAQFDTVATKWPASEFTPYALYFKGLSQLDAKEYAAGVESLNGLLTNHATHKLAADAHFVRGMCRRQADDAKGAVEDIDAYLKSNPELAQKSGALFEKGLAQVALKDFPGAVTTFDAILKDDRKFAAADKVLYELGWALKSQDKHAEAVPIFANLAEEFPDCAQAAEANFHVADDLYDKKKFAEALKTYGLAKAKAPQGDLAEKSLYKLGWSNYELKQFDAALKDFSQQVQDYPQGTLAGDGQFMVGECLFKLAKYKEALTAYAAALKATPNSPTVETLLLLHAGQSAAQLKLWADSVKWLAPIITKFPDSPFVAEALYEQGWAQQNLNKTDEALKLYEEAAGKSRGEVGARSRFMMGEINFGAKNYDEAIKQFQRAMFGFGGEQAPPEVKNWQAQSGYEAARCNEVRILTAKDAAEKAKFVAEAKKNYEYVVEKHATHAKAAEAKKRLVELAKVK